jgi:MinD-like ATPase involved in chromosome partitioning or flagellar assembly
MIRDLRNARAYNAAPDVASLAFSRAAVASTQEVKPSDGEAGHHTTACTIAVTAPRLITCKRGVAAHLAASLALTSTSESVCVVDIDIESRDIGTRFGVTAPLLLDVANTLGSAIVRTPIEERLTHTPSGVAVLPTRPPAPALLPQFEAKTPAVVRALRSAFDFLVVDAPVGLGEAPWHTDILRSVDVLLVAVTADASALGSALRYLHTLASARNRGILPSTFATHVVLTGADDGSRTIEDVDVARKLQGISVLGSIPQLWGRQRPAGALDALEPELARALASIVQRATTAET